MNGDPVVSPLAKTEYASRYNRRASRNRKGLLNVRSDDDDYLKRKQAESERERVKREQHAQSVRDAAEDIKF